MKSLKRGSSGSLAAHALFLLTVVSVSTVPFQRLRAAAEVTFRSGENAVTLLELYTSEGCSSCPPAEAWLNQLRKSPQLWRSVIPLAFHVDYWNRLGWPDRFSSAEFTKRQREYAATWGGNSIYTPGFVVNGAESRGGKPTIPAPGVGPRVGALEVTVRGESVTVSFSPVSPLKGYRISLALLGTDLVSEVKRGENSGRKLTHEFVVLHFGTAPLEAGGRRSTGVFTLPPPGAERPTAIAVWVTASDSLVPIQATGGWLVGE